MVTDFKQNFFRFLSSCYVEEDYLRLYLGGWQVREWQRME